MTDTHDRQSDARSAATDASRLVDDLRDLMRQPRPLRLRAPMPPTMLSECECQFLQGLTREIYSAAGRIVDLGSFLGGSTVSLASGLAANPKRDAAAARIHSYDQFVWSEGLHGFFANLPRPLQPGDSFLDLFEGATRPWQDRLVVHAGDVTTFPWDESPIEILFVDVCKTAEVNEFVVREFFPALIPGRSVVIQQDYLWPYCCWVHVTMEVFGDRFRHVGDLPYNSRLYVLERAIRLEEAAAFRYADIPFDDKERMVAAARDSVNDPLHRAALGINHAILFQQHDRPEQARERLLDFVRRWDGDWRHVLLFKSMLAWILGMPADRISRATLEQLAAAEVGRVEARADDGGKWTNDAA